MTNKDNLQHDDESSEKHKLIEALKIAAPFMQKIFPFDCMIGVADEDSRFVAYLPSKTVNLGDVVGTIIPPGDPIREAIHTGSPQQLTVPKETFGVPYRAIGVPVRDENDNIVGGVGFGMSLQEKEDLTEAVETFASASEEVAATSQELANSAQELSYEMESLTLLQQEMIEQVNKTNVMLDLINKVAMNSNLLGLNASIEAARAGEHGRGFDVVAKEIRKMADNSANSVKEIQVIIAEIKDKVTLINTAITKVSDISQHQAAASEEIAASIQQLAASAENIQVVADLL